MKLVLMEPLDLTESTEKEAADAGSFESGVSECHKPEAHESEVSEVVAPAEGNAGTGGGADKPKGGAATATSAIKGSSGSGGHPASSAPSAWSAVVVGCFQQWVQQ